MVIEYGNKSLMPLLAIDFLFLNPNIDGGIELIINDDDDNSILEVVTSNETTLQGLVKNELSLFHHLPMKPKDVVLPLNWWKIHEA